MFGKRPGLDGAETSVLAEGSALEGTITVRGALRVDGAVSGRLAAEGDITVGDHGQVLGEVRASSLAVSGRVAGIVYARAHLCVFAKGGLSGHARYSSLEVERGGTMNASTSLTCDYPESADDYDADE